MLDLLWFCYHRINHFCHFLKKIHTVVSPSSHTPSSHTYPSSHTLFGLTKMWLLGYVKDFRRIKSLIFFGRRANHFLLFLKNCVIQDWIWGFSGNLRSSISGDFFSSLSGTNSRVICDGCHLFYFFTFNLGICFWLG